MHHSEHNIDHLSVEEMKEIAKDAMEAYEVLTFHFIKEESIIFPMVVSILQSEE